MHLTLKKCQFWDIVHLPTRIIQKNLHRYSDEQFIIIISSNNIYIIYYWNYHIYISYFLRFSLEFANWRAGLKEEMRLLKIASANEGSIGVTWITRDDSFAGWNNFTISLTMHWLQHFVVFGPGRVNSSILFAHPINASVNFFLSNCKIPLFILLIGGGLFIQICIRIEYDKRQWWLDIAHCSHTV